MAKGSGIPSVPTRKTGFCDRVTDHHSFKGLTASVCETKSADHPKPTKARKLAKNHSSHRSSTSAPQSPIMHIMANTVISGSNSSTADMKNRFDAIPWESYLVNLRKSREKFIEAMAHFFEFFNSDTKLSYEQADVRCIVTFFRFLNGSLAHSHSAKQATMKEAVTRMMKLLDKPFHLTADTAATDLGISLRKNNGYEPTPINISKVKSENEQVLAKTTEANNKANEILTESLAKITELNKEADGKNSLIKEHERRIRQLEEIDEGLAEFAFYDLSLNSCHIPNIEGIDEDERLAQFARELDDYKRLHPRSEVLTHTSIMASIKESKDAISKAKARNLEIAADIQYQ